MQRFRRFEVSYDVGGPPERVEAGCECFEERATIPWLQQQ